MYLIGGAARTGKSTLAHMLLERKHIAYESVDSIYHMLMFAAPELKIKVKTDQDTNKIKKAQTLYPFLKALIMMKHWEMGNYCIEGDGFLPEQVAKFLEEIPKEKGIENFKLKCIFLGYSTADLKMILENQGHNDWLSYKSEKEQQETFERLLKMSEFLKEGCEKYGFTYIDMAGSYQENLEKAYLTLTS